MKLRLERKTVLVKRMVGEEELVFEVALLTPKEINQLLENSTEHEWDRGQRFDRPNYYKFAINKLDKMIVSWSGVEDDAGNPLDCNRKNKEVVYAYYSDLLNSVLEEAEALGKEEADFKEDSEKN